MPAPPALIVAWGRSAVAPVGGALGRLQAHEIGAPVLQALLQRLRLPAQAVDAVVLGNALGAGGNPARLLALAAGLPQQCAALSVDTQCCAGLDAVSLAVGLLASGQASVVVAGGAEAWSRAPLRMHRPERPGATPQPYERPRFVPEPREDPDLLESAAAYALREGFSRAQQDAYALHSHARAVAHQAMLAQEIVPVAGLARDAYPRLLDAARAARMPRVAGAANPAGGSDCSLSALGISAKADGAALVLLATEPACRRFGLEPRATWVAGASVGSEPSTPLVAAEAAAREALRRGGSGRADELAAIELHDAFAVQGLAFCRNLGLDWQRINARGGGLARGHPIGASGAIALVRLLSGLCGEDATPQGWGLASVAGAGGIGSAALVRAL